ncbi:MAG: DUF975 family protein [Ruminococcus sp.]|nr:DUF975 family protein [Ruminococcus sp.]
MSAEIILKAQARDKLKQGGWAKALFALAILTIVYMIIECFSSLGYYLIELLNPDSTIEFIIEVSGGTIATIVALLLSPFVLGFFRMFYSDDRDYSLNDVMYYFSTFGKYTKAIKFVLGFVLRMILPVVVYFLLPASIFAVAKIINNGDSLENGIKILIIALAITSTVLVLRHSIRYFVSILLLCENECEKTSYYFTTSKEIMRHHEKDVVKLILSFFWWILSSITGLPALYVIPYISQAMCLSGKWLTQLSRNGQDI